MSETRKEAAQDVTQNCEETQEVELSEKDLEKVAGGVGTATYEIVQGNRGPQAEN